MNTRALVATAALAAMSFGASGAITIYDGRDAGVGPGGPRPLSDAAQAAFAAAAGGLGAIDVRDIEGLAPGFQANGVPLALGAGVSATFAGNELAVFQGVSAGNDDVTLGYNTTAFGRNHLRVVPEFNIGTAGVQFDFAAPIQAWGAYITGLGTANGNLTAVFNNGSTQTLAIVGGGGGGVQFYGFTDPGSSIASVRLELTGVVGSRDIFGVDDIHSVVIPSPGAAAALLVGLTALSRRRR